MSALFGVRFEALKLVGVPQLGAQPVVVNVVLDEKLLVPLAQTV